MQRLRRLRREEGQYLVWFLMLFPLILALVGLVVDGGFMYVWYRRCQVAADTAAQAAAHEVDAAHFQATGEVVLSEAAWEVAQEFAACNSGGRVEVVLVSVTPDNHVQVAARAHVPTLFMRAFGLDEVAVGISSQARPAFGIIQEGQ